MAHNTVPNQKVKIRTISIAFPETLHDNFISDYLSDLLSTEIVVSANIMLDWAYISKQVIRSAGDNPREGDLFPNATSPFPTYP